MRVVYLTREIAMAHMTFDFEISERPSGVVSGRFWSTSGPENRSALERIYGCRTVQDSVPYWAWVCRVAAPPVNWRSVLATLDRIGVMAPPPPDSLPLNVCNDGVPWTLVVRRPALGDSVMTEQSCVVYGERRATFERRIDSVITAVQRQVARTP